MSILRALAVLLLSALPASAEGICDPDPGTRLVVTGVAANDTLNMRSGPSASQGIVSRIRPGERGVAATGRAAWAKGQCSTTCSGAEGGLNDTGRSIAYGCKAKGGIWYEVRRANGAVGWASGKYLDLAGGGPAVQPPVVTPVTPTVPDVEARLTYRCGADGTLDVAIYRGGDRAGVTIGGKTYLVLRRDHLLVRYSFAAGDGARLRGGPSLIEWRWPDGRKTNCTRN